MTSTFLLFLIKLMFFLHRQAVVGSGDEVYSNIGNAQVDNENKFLDLRIDSLL